MELWIRSQDKESLLKINNLEIKEFKEGYGIGQWLNESNFYGLSIYKSKERALEILNEIQEHIQKQGQSYMLTDEKGIPAGLKEYGNIYEMPEK